MRLIDADALKEDIEQQCALLRLTKDNDELNQISMVLETGFMAQIDKMPTIEERKKGKWILDENPHDGDCRCSVCFVAIDAMHERHHGLYNALTGGKWWTFYKFCPNCGADMRGETWEH